MEIKEFDEIDTEQRNTALYMAINGSVIDVARFFYPSFTDRGSDEAIEEINM